MVHMAGNYRHPLASSLLSAKVSVGNEIQKVVQKTQDEAEEEQRRG